MFRVMLPHLRSSRGIYFVLCTSEGRQINWRLEIGLVIGSKNYTISLFSSSLFTLYSVVNFYHFGKGFLKLFSIIIKERRSWSCSLIWATWQMEYVMSFSYWLCVMCFRARCHVCRLPNKNVRIKSKAGLAVNLSNTFTPLCSLSSKLGKLHSEADTSLLKHKWWAYLRMKCECVANRYVKA